MNINRYSQPSHRENLAYINKNVDMKDGTIAEIAKAAQKTALEVMKDMKSQGLTFKNTVEKDGKSITKTCAAAVKVAKATEIQSVTLADGSKQDLPVQKKNKNGDPTYNVSISIAKGSETLQLNCSQYLDGDKARITSMRWSDFNRQNPKASPSAKGIDEINKSKASPELKAIAVAVDKGGYIKADKGGVQIDKNLDKDDARAVALANAMANSMRELVNDPAVKDSLFDVTIEKDGEEKTFPVSAYVTVSPMKEKDGTPKLNDNKVPQYFVQGGFSNKGSNKNETLTVIGSNNIHEDEKGNSVALVGLRATDFTGGTGNQVQYKQEEIANSPLSDEIKNLASAIEKSGKLYVKSELRSFAYELNAEVFKTKVMVEQENPDTGKMEDVERKLLNAKYKNDEDYGESITIFNKSDKEVPVAENITIKESDVMVALTNDEQYGHTIKVINNAITPVLDENGKPTAEIKLRTDKESEKPSYTFVNNAQDVVDLLPDLPELQEAVAKFSNDFTLEDIKDVLEGNAPTVENDAPADIDVPDAPDNLSDFEEIGGYDLEEL